MHPRTTLVGIVPRALIVLLASLAFLAASCGDDDSAAAPETTTTRATTAATIPTATTEDGIDTLEGASTNAVEGAATQDQTALLEQVALGRHEGYDRVVFRFRDGVPGYHVSYVEPPLREDGSGKEVAVAGDAFVVVRMEPASGFDLTKPEGELVYEGPRRLRGSDFGTSVVRDVVRTGDFEAVLSWAVGLSDRVDFRVIKLEHPARLVVDFRNH